MRYDLTNKDGINEAEFYFTKLKEKGATVEIIEKHKNRSISQNSYLHLLLGYCALEAGMSTDEFKLSIYKIIINRDIFINKETNKFGLNYTKIKSTSEITTSELATSIDKLKRFVAENMNLYLPEANEHVKLDSMSNTVEKNKQWI